MIEDIAAGRVERGVRLVHGSPGCGDAFFQHARHPVAFPARGGETVQFGLRIARGSDGGRGEGGQLGAHGAGHKAVGVECHAVPAPDPQGIDPGNRRRLPLVARDAVGREFVVPDGRAGSIGHGQALDGERPAVGAQRGFFQVEGLAAFVFHGSDLDAVAIRGEARLAHRNLQGAELVHELFVALYGYTDARDHDAIDGFFEHDFVADVPLPIGNERVEEAHTALIRGAPQGEGDAVAGCLNRALGYLKCEIALGDGREREGAGSGGAERIDDDRLLCAVIEILRRTRDIGSAEGAGLHVQHGLEAHFAAQFRSGFDLRIDGVLPFVGVAGSL